MSKNQENSRTYTNTTVVCIVLPNNPIFDVGSRDVLPTTTVKMMQGISTRKRVPECNCCLFIEVFYNTGPSRRIRIEYKVEAEVSSP